MKTYIGTKIIKSTPMNRADYNILRGWALPADEDGTDEGYLVEYTDGGKPNLAGYDGYVSWSPKVQFEGAYIEIGDVTGLTPHQQRVVAERAELDDKRKKLEAFIDSEKFRILCDRSERSRMRRQHANMTDYSNVLGDRIACMFAAETKGDAS